MARVNYVKKAQQRFKTVPVLNEDGSPKTTPVLRRDGSPKKTKTGREIVRRVTVEDPNQPLPNRKCERCSKEIANGEPYKWVKTKSGPYGGAKKVRCGTCPSWQPWELSSSMSARLQQIEHDATHGVDVTDADAVSQALGDMAQAVRELAEEKREAAENIEEGFGHATSSSEELADIADQLETWANELESASDEADGLEVQEEEIDCEECNGEGEVDNPDYDPDDKDSPERIECNECGGTGQVENPEYENYESELQELFDKTGECPV